MSWTSRGCYAVAPRALTCENEFRSKKFLFGVLEHHEQDIPVKFVSIQRRIYLRNRITLRIIRHCSHLSEGGPTAYEILKLSLKIGTDDIGSVQSIS